MNPIAKALIVMGVFFIILGVLWAVGGKSLYLGKLPGDILVKKGNFNFFFPITTCIFISVLGSLIFYIIRLFSRK